MMLKRARETNAFSASSTLSGDDRTYTAKVVRDTWRQNIERTHKKVKVWFYTAQFPVRWTAQVIDDLDRYMSSTMSCLWDCTNNCGDLHLF